MAPVVLVGIKNRHKADVAHAVIKRDGEEIFVRRGVATDLHDEELAALERCGLVFEKSRGETNPCS